MLIGILFLSFAAFRSGRVVLSGMLFTFLLCTKHLFLSLAPLYFLLLLRFYVLERRKQSHSGPERTYKIPILRSFMRLIEVALFSVILPAAAVLSPILLQPPDPLTQANQVVTNEM